MSEDLRREDWSEAGTFEIVPGIHRIPLPLPGDGLVAVNVYAMDDGDAVTLIDAGWLTVETPEVLDAGLLRIDRELSNVHRILVTHLHRDHYSLALEIRRRFGARVELGVDESPSVERIMGPEPRMRALGHRLHRAGATSLEERWRSAERLGPPTEYELPDAWIAGNSTVKVGERILEIISTPGHTRGHLVFHDRDESLLFAGDHVLPHITPSIGFEPVPPDSPLEMYLGSLAVVRERPDARLLPAHGPVVDSVHRRVDELFSHHRRRLDVSRDAVAGGAASAFEVAGVLKWTRSDRSFADLDLLNQILAVNETLAHLDVLVARGLLTSEVKEEATIFAVPPNVAQMDSVSE